MKKIIIITIIALIGFTSANAQNATFRTAVKELGDILELKVDKVFPDDVTVIYSKEFEDNTQYLVLTFYQDYFALKVPFYEYQYMLDLFPDNNLLFTTILLECNSSQVFGAWGIEEIEETVYLGLYYKLPIVTDEVLSAVVNMMLTYVNDLETTMNEAKAGLGFAGNELSPEEFKDLLFEINEKYNEEFKQKFEE